ncbi:MAG: hypothetical protein M3Y30_16760, partial [Gemmatimonadota bacterium]|nr:hypothetical protein [Gemmatimonadota bacterium]
MSITTSLPRSICCTSPERRSPTRVGDLLSGEVQQIERGKLVVMLNKFREAEAIIPYREQNHREHYHQGEPI